MPRTSPAHERLVAVAACFSLVCAQSPCTYKCDDCGSNPYYTQVNGTCIDTGKQPTAYVFGTVYCGLGNAVIHSRATCEKLNEHQNTSYGHLGNQWDIRMVWNSSHGCIVESKPPFWVGVDRIIAPVCICVHRWFEYVISLTVGTIAGICLGTVGTVCQRKSLTTKDHFWPGAKVLASEHFVGYWRRKMVLFYRICQVIANAWLPMCLMIFFDTRIVLPLWLLLYFVPGLVGAGKYVFKQPAYILCPPDASLYGIDHKQRDKTALYALSAVRPLLICGGITLLSELFINANSPEVVFNEVGFFRVGLLHGFAPLVLDFTVIVSALGTFMHMSMTAGLVYQKWFNGHPNTTLSLVKDDAKLAKVTSLANKICAAAVDVDSDSSESEIDEGRKEKIRRLGVKPLSRWRVLTNMVMCLIDLASYFYKIFVFLSAAHYFQAAIITAALSESFFVLCLNGNIKRAPISFRRAARDGVATIGYISLCQWDNGIAGVPYLLITIYGLPVAFDAHDQSNFIICASSIFFMCTGTRAMGKFIKDAVDNDMFNAGSFAKELDEVDDTIVFLEGEAGDFASQLT